MEVDAGVRAGGCAGAGGGLGLLPSGVLSFGSRSSRDQLSDPCRPETSNAFTLNKALVHQHVPVSVFENDLGPECTIFIRKRAHEKVLITVRYCFHSTQASLLKQRLSVAEAAQQEQTYVSYLKLCSW